MKKITLALLIIFCAGCSTIKQELAVSDTDDLIVYDNKLTYWSKLEKRNLDDLNMVVIHATELSDLAEAQEYGERILYESGTGASGHYYIDRDGSIEMYVPEDHIANHTSGWNKKTIGIELVNIGRYPNWYHTDHQVMKEAYPKEQIDALVLLVNEFKRRYPTIKYTQGHEDLDTRMVPAENDPNRQIHRKMDPGEHFPWEEFVVRTGLLKETPLKLEQQ